MSSINTSRTRRWVVTEVDRDSSILRGCRDFGDHRRGCISGCFKIHLPIIALPATQLVSIVGENVQFLTPCREHLHVSLAIWFAGRDESSELLWVVELDGDISIYDACSEVRVVNLYTQVDTDGIRTRGSSLAKGALCQAELLARKVDTKIGRAHV